MSKAEQSVAVAVQALIRDDQANGREPDLERYLVACPGAELEVAKAFQSCLGTERGPQDKQAEVPEASSIETARSNRVGPYQLVRPLGHGGQSTVWLAQDERLQREVAIKLAPLQAELDPGSSNDQLPRHIQRELEAAAAFDHPAFCSVYESGVDDEHAWLAMRYVPGETLDQWAQTHQADEDYLPRLLNLMSGVSRGLHAAHAAGLVHRDVKPTNIVITPEEQPIILDLGVSTLDNQTTTITKSGGVHGTPAYLPPEVLMGKEPGPAQDLWALGVSTYELAHHERPFRAPTFEGLTRSILMDEPTPSTTTVVPNHMRGDLHAVLQKALTKEHGGRYTSAEEFAQELECMAQGQPVRARTLGALGRTVRWMRRRPAISATVALATLGLLAATLVSTTQLRVTRDTLDQNDNLLGEISGVSDSTVALKRLSEVDELWPIHPDLVQPMQDWIDSVDGILLRSDRHMELRNNFSEATPATPQTTHTRNLWLVEQLDALIAARPQLEEALAELEQRHAEANGLYELTVVAQAEAWQRVASELRADPRFDGIDLPPQVGLIPLGVDPDSKLQEFALAPTGKTPRRSAEGKLELELGHAMVFVFLPGGAFRMGSIPPEPSVPGRELGDPRVDPETDVLTETPILDRQIEPYFISKYELHNDIWIQHNKVESSIPRDTPASRRHPAFQISWLECQTVLPRLGLAIPSEAQWEYAARAGTDTIWYTGNTAESLKGHVNLKDLAAKRFSETRGVRDAGHDAWLDDGHVMTAPIGSFQANGFGLHDIIGNLSEWTTGVYALEGDTQARRERGDDDRELAMATIRGGHFQENSEVARIKTRYGEQPSTRVFPIGVRPVRPVDPVDPGLSDSPGFNNTKKAER